MLTKRSRDLLPQRTEPTPFVTKAKDLGALRDAVVDAATVSAGLWISYLFALFYFAIAAGAVTHRDLLLESPVKLPFLNVELPLKAFFFLGPLVFLVVHAYVLLHFALLTGKIGAFHVELQAQISGDDARARLRRQLPSNIFVQSLAGPQEARTGTIGFLLRLIIWISLVLGPIALLILFQLRFLPYHSEWITWWQRIVVVADLVLLWILWPRIARGEIAGLGWRDFKRVKVQVLLLASVLPVLLVCEIATFPDEWFERHFRWLPIVPTQWPTWGEESNQANNAAEKNQGTFAELKLRTAAALGSMGWTSPRELLVAGQVNYVTGRPQSLWPNVLVLPGFELGDRVKFDAQGKVVISSDALSLRGRSLEGAVLVNAHLRKADFTGASLAGANFVGADLREAKFECDHIGGEQKCAQLQHASFAFAELQGASFQSAQLQGADFDEAQLQGASLSLAALQDALLERAQLQGASLFYARLQRASLSDAQLQGANVALAELQVAFLERAQLQGASLNRAQLQGASLNRAQLQGASLYYAQLQGASLENAQLQGASLENAQLQGASLENAQLQGASLRHAFLWRAKPPKSENATGALVEAPELEPKYFGLDCDAPLSEGCDWSQKSYAALKSVIENRVPAGGFWRAQTLKRIATLENPPYVRDEASARAWADTAEASSRSPKPYPEVLAETLEDVGCAADGAPYVMSGLIRELDYRFEKGSSQEAAVAAAFLNEAKCPGARGLSEENKAKLQEIRDRGLPKSH
jgi:uncharacterized protein YjbI with pentapeptide repeats